MSYSFDEEQAQRRSFTRRLAIFGGVQAAVMVALGARLYDLQVTRREDFALRAERNRVDLEPLAAARGRILDRNGAVMATNRQTFQLFLRADRRREAFETLERLHDLIGLDRGLAARALTELASGRGGGDIELLADAPWATFARVSANLPALPAAAPREALRRLYPAGGATAHLVGYVAAVSETDLARARDPLLRMPGARIGRSGVERALETQLRGAAGARRVEVDALGREVRELSRDSARDGADVRLTIDLALQSYAARRLGDEAAALALMDVASGEVLALASSPSFDPNLFVTGVTREAWGALLQDPKKPLLDKAISGLYPPGSTFKAISALAALEFGAPTPDAVVRCTGSIEFGGRRFHCWKRGGHGRVRMLDAIKNSCDVYFYEVAQRVGARRLAAMAQRFGVGVAPDLPLPGVKAGLMPSPDWKEASGRGAWNGGDTLNAAIGQGAVLTTPLQLAVMAARLANGQAQVAPRLVLDAADDRGGLRPPPALGVRPEHLALVREGLNAVMNEKGGTAYAQRIAEPRFLMAGKTGTSQVRSISAAERVDGVRANEELPRELRDHALFVAYAPVDAPRYAIAVVVEHGGSGSGAAAPIARDVLLRAFYGGEPPLEAYPAEAREAVAAARAAGL